MPDKGVPRSPDLTAPTAASHTGTQQWQSFEIRMRHRRAERCRLRAEVAIEAGFFDDAREALDEARRLQPDLPDLVITEQRLADAQIQDVALPRQPRRRMAVRAAGAVALLAAASGATVLIPDNPAATVRPPAIVVPAAPSQLATAIASAQSPASMALAPRGTIDDTSRGAPPERFERAPANADAESDGERPQPLVAAAPVIVVPPPEPARPSNGAGMPLPPAPESGVPAPPPSTTLPPASPPPLETSPTESAPRAEPAADPAAEPADAKVRAALSRYEAAYSALNAAAARAIWPTVNAEALDRAFDSLESQQISLGTCSIAVAPDGRTAHATCAGTATWTPRVGGGTNTEPRRWLFDLDLNGDRWQIVRATTR